MWNQCVKKIPWRPILPIGVKRRSTKPDNLCLFSSHPFYDQHKFNNPYLVMKVMKRRKEAILDKGIAGKDGHRWWRLLQSPLSDGYSPGSPNFLWCWMMAIPAIAVTTATPIICSRMSSHCMAVLLANRQRWFSSSRSWFSVSNLDWIQPWG